MRRSFTVTVVRQILKSSKSSRATDTPSPLFQVIAVVVGLICMAFVLWVSHGTIFSPF